MQDGNMVFVLYYCYEKRAGALRIPHKILFLICNLSDADSTALTCFYYYLYTTNIARKTNAFYYGNTGDIHTAFNLFHDILVHIYNIYI